MRKIIFLLGYLSFALASCNKDEMTEKPILHFEAEFNGNNISFMHQLEYAVIEIDSKNHPMLWGFSSPNKKGIYEQQLAIIFYGQFVGEALPNFGNYNRIKYFDGNELYTVESFANQEPDKLYVFIDEWGTYLKGKFSGELTAVESQKKIKITNGKIFVELLKP